MSQTTQPSANPARDPRRRTWRTLVGMGVVVVAAILVAMLLARCAASGSSQAQGPFGRGGRANITVGIATASLGDVPITVNALGTVTPENTVSVTSRVTGILTQVRFTEGQLVRKGAVLAVVDPSSFQAALNQAQGTLAHDQATLAGAERDLSRYQSLLAENSIARQTVDDQAATVRQEQGVVAADKGNVQNAQLNLQWTRVSAPISGRVGLRQIDAGNQVAANGSTPIAIVAQIDPIDVIFAVPEDAIPAIVRHPNFGAGLPVTAYDRSGGSVLAEGALGAIDNVVDTTTGTVKGKARFANPTGALFPNQFVNVTVLVDTLKQQVNVPTTAIRHGPQGDFVYVLQPDKTVKVTLVKTGPGSGETTSIASGVSAGDVVITDGGDRLRDGAAVNLPNPHAAPGAGGRAGHRGGGATGGGRGGGGGGGGFGGGFGGGPG